MTKRAYIGNCGYPHALFAAMGLNLEKEVQKYVNAASLPEVRVFIAASRVLDKKAERIPQRYIDAAWLLGLLETDIDCDPPYIYATCTQKFLDLQEKYYALVRPEIFA